jgi:tRNA uracil 4-sulfurtransferase
MHEVLVVHYDEIALKRRRRPYYEKRLLTGIHNALRDLPRSVIECLHDRVVVFRGKTEIPVELLRDRLSTVFGVRYLLEGLLTASDGESLRAAMLRIVAERQDVRSFGVRVRRLVGHGGRTSIEIAAELGGFIVEKTGWAVDLTAPDLWFDVVFLGPRALVSGRRVEGPGGLPVGTTGHGVALLSGGIDSPVAAWLMMRRGLKLSVVHFHSAPFTDRASQEKVRDLALALTRYQPTIEMASIPFADLQQTLVAATPARYRVVLYRRFMVRIAEALARAVGATCLVTGDALAQVASQTVENLGTIDAAASMPVLRPLIGMGKSEVIGLGRTLGTYEISIRPHDDCCAFLLPEHPATATTAAELLEVERDLPIAEMVAAAVARREVSTVRFEDAIEKRGAATGA